MTGKLLNFKAPPSLALVEGATTPSGGVVGAACWSTTLGRLMYWNGTLWTATRSTAFSAPTLTNNTVITTETIVARWGIPANSVAALDNLLVNLAGQVSSTATLTFRIRFGTAGTTADALLSTFTVSAAGVANAYHYLDAVVSFLSSTTATAAGTSTLAAGVVGNATAAFAAATVNLTVANFLSITLVQSIAQTYTSRAAKLSV